MLALLLLLQPAFAQFSISGGVINHGRATNYGPTDQFSSDWRTGSCKCWGPGNYNPATPCFDDIVSPAHITAVNTNGNDLTATCGTCLAVTCVNGPTRGLDWSTYSTPGCVGNATVFVQVTDSCPCQQNPSNLHWCCNETSTITRHLDLSSPAFTLIADPSAGVVDVLFQEVPCPDAANQLAITGVSWATWERYAGTTVQAFSASRPFSGDVLANIQGAAPTVAPGPDYTFNRTGEIEPKGPFLRAGKGNVTGFVFTDSG